MARLSGVVFDLDGTLVDSRADLVASVNAMLRRMGLPERDEATVVSFVGEGAERLIRRSLGPSEDRYPEAAPIWRDEYARRLLDQTRLYDGIAEVLQLPVPKAVLTNKPGGFARQILRGLGVAGAFVAVLGGDEGPRKPSPDGLLQLCRTMGITPDEAMLVGDSAVDVATAKAANVRVCAVLWGLGSPESFAGADERAATPAELSALLARLVNGATRGGFPHGFD
jgi:phosphoglycolate phosphatase